MLAPRERVLRAFSHKEVDRVPRDIGSTIVTTFTKNAYRNFLDYIKIKETYEIEDAFQGVVIPSEKVMQLLNIDFRRVGFSNRYDIIDYSYTDCCGIKYKRAFPHDYYDIFFNPLKDFDINSILNYPWPKFEYDNKYKDLSLKAKDLYENSNYAIVGDLILCGFNEFGQKLIGYENYFIDLIDNKNLIIKLFDILLEIQKNIWSHYLNAIGKNVHVICWGDDLGTQDRPQVSPKIFKELLKPYYKKMFSFIKERTDAKLFMHSCGDIYPYIEDLVESGVDILNPVQINANEMEPKRLKNKFGDKLIFWGGVDIQFLLRSCGIEEVHKYVKDIVDIFGKDGGYVLSAAHNIQEDIPPQNVFALFNSGKNNNIFK